MYHTVSIETDLDVPGRDVWRVLNDFGSHYTFNPLVRLSPITNGIARGPGAEREVVMYDGAIIRQRVLDWDEGRSLLIGFTQTDLPISNATARFSVEPPDQPFCRVRVDVTFEPAYGVLGSMAGYLYRPAIRSRYSLVLRGLKHFVTTGQPVGQRVP